MQENVLREILHYFDRRELYLFQLINWRLHTIIVDEFKNGPCDLLPSLQWDEPFKPKAWNIDSVMDASKVHKLSCSELNTSLISKQKFHRCESVEIYSIDSFFGAENTSDSGQQNDMCTQLLESLAHLWINRPLFITWNCSHHNCGQQESNLNEICRCEFMTAKLLPLLARCRYLKVTNPPVPPIIRLMVFEDSAIREWRFHRATDLLLTNPLFFPNLVKFLFKELPYTGLERNSHAFSGLFFRGVKKRWIENSEWLHKVQLPVPWQKVKPLSNVEVTISTAVSDETLVTNLLDMIIEAFNQSKKPGIFVLSWVCSGSRRAHTANLRPFIKTHPNPEIKDALKLFVSDPTLGHFTIARQNADTFYNSMSSRIEFQ